MGSKKGEKITSNHVPKDIVVLYKDTELREPLGDRIRKHHLMICQLSTTNTSWNEDYISVLPFAGTQDINLPRTACLLDNC